MEMLTYDRLVARMHPLFASLPSHFEGERLRLLRTAIESVIIACKKGLTGDQETLSPGQLKHWVERKIQSIHESFDNPSALQATSTNKRKRTTADEDATAAKKAKRDGDGEMRHFAAAILALCSSSPPSTPPHPHITHDMRLIAAGRKIYTRLPVVDRKRGPKPTFLAGVTYAMENIRKHGMGITTNTERFTEYVRAELGIEKTIERRSEVEATESLLGMMGAGCAAGQSAGDENAGVAAGPAKDHIEDENSGRATRQGDENLGGHDAGQAVSKSFWNVI